MHKNGERSFECFMQQSCPVPVQLEYTNEDLLKLRIGARVAERIEGTVEIAEPIGDVVHGRVDAVRTEADDQRKDVPRRPADHERAQDDRDGPQSLLRSVLAFLRRFARQRGFALETVPERIQRRSVAFRELSFCAASRRRQRELGPEAFVRCQSLQILALAKVTGRGNIDIVDCDLAGADSTDCVAGHTGCAVIKSGIGCVVMNTCCAIINNVTICGVSITDNTRYHAMRGTDVFGTTIWRRECALTDQALS